jgi:glycerol uptake facilitator protein
MAYLSEFVGSLIFLLGGYSYMCNITLKKTLVGKLNYIELVFAWSLAVGFGLAISAIMGGPAYLNPGVVIGSYIAGSISIVEALLYILMEFAAAGVAVLVCIIFFWDSFKASGEEVSKRGIFSAYPVEKNLVLNFFQELIATFVFLFIVFMAIAGITATKADNQSLAIGVVGFAAVALMALSLNSTGFSMNAMRSFFSSIWFALLPIPNKGKETVDWNYQIIVNLIGSSIGGALAVLTTGYLKSVM